MTPIDDGADAAPIVHASAPLAPESRILLWHGGTPHTGRLLAPVLAIARALDRELVCVARPGADGCSWASASLACRSRPVMTSPAAKPHNRRSSATTRRRTFIP